MINLLVIQSSPFCNIDCDYCYLPNRGSRKILSLDTVGYLFRRLCESSLLGSHLGVVWHAGEPLATPMSFYEVAIARIDELTANRCVVSHSMQTNGMLITPDWCNFIRRIGLQIGVSLDGPALVHDAHRKTRAGKGTHAKVMSGIALLQRYRIPFHVIAVVTERSLDVPDEIFAFFLDNGIHRVGFNIEEIEGMHTSSSLAGSATAGRYRAFMTRMYQLSRDSNWAVSIREFEWARNVICQDPGARPGASPPAVANHQVTPFGILSVDCDGNFSTFSPELLGQSDPVYGAFTFGNVRSESLESIWQVDGFRRVRQDIVAGVDLCRQTCEYFALCGGGAPVNKYAENGTFRSSETMYCRYSIQTPIDLVLEDLETSLCIPVAGDGPVTRGV